MGAISRLLAADRRRGAGFNGKFEVKDGKLDAGTIEAIPMRLDDVYDSFTNLWGNIDTDNEVFVELRQVTLTLPEMDVGADIDKRFGRVADGLAKLFKFKDALIDVIAIIHWNIAVNGLGAPDLRRNLDHQGVSEWRGRGGRWGSGDSRVRARAREERRWFSVSMMFRELRQVIVIIVIVGIGVVNMGRAFGHCRN
jgi:hypothetical protein